MGIDFIFAAILLSLMIIIATCLYYERIAGISPTPSLPWVRSKIIESVKSRMNVDGKYEIAELGSGWGGMSISLANAFPKSLVRGFEISFFPYWVSVIRYLRFGNRVSSSNNCLFKEDISKFDLVICYLSNHHMQKLKPQLKKMKKGSIIVSNGFAIPDWKEDEIIIAQKGIEIKIFIYVVS